MKQHLRFLLLATLTSVPVVSVVACGTSSVGTITDKDILTKAEGLMRQHPFTMTELSLMNIPPDAAEYETWSEVAKEKIGEYYSSLVSSSSSNWEHETVAVTIRGVVITWDDEGNIIDEQPSKFINKYGALVESRITLTADLSFKGLTSSVPIVVKVTNDTAYPADKVNAIRDYLKTYLNNLTTPIMFKTLFKDNLASNDATFDYEKITLALRATLFTSADGEIPVIDVEGVKITVKPLPVADPGPGTIIYTLGSTITPAVPDPNDPDKNLTPAMVNGTLQGLTLQIDYDKASAELAVNDLTQHEIKVAQTFPDINNQVAAILNQGSEAIWFRDDALPGAGHEMPTANQTFNSYGLSSSVQTLLFNKISEVYPPAKMGGWWTAGAMTFPNAGTSTFVYRSVLPPERPDGDVYLGYFDISVKFECQFDSNSKILANFSDLRINLSKKYA